MTVPSASAPTGPGGPAPVAGDRPAPLIASLAGTAGGVLLLISLFLLLGEIGGDNQRIAGIGVSLLFEAVGVGLLVLHRGGRSATAGVALTAIGVVPLVVYLFVDVQDPGRTIDDVGSFTRTATLGLLVAAALWLGAYVAGPGRRYGFYLGAGLVALWLVSVVQILDAPIGQVVNGFGNAPVFTPIGPGTDDFGSDEFGTDGFDDLGTEDFEDFRSDELGSDGFGTDGFEDFGSDDFEDFEDEFSDDLGDVDTGPGDERIPPEAFPQPGDPSTKLGAASLLFGGAYLAAGWARDRRRDLRQGTVLLAVAAPILTLAVPLLSGTLESTGTALLGLVLGAVAVWVGTRSGRRFTSWYGTFAVVVATTSLVADAVGDSLRLSALVFAVLGLALALVAGRAGGTDPAPDIAAGPGGDGWAPPATGWVPPTTGWSPPATGGEPGPQPWVGPPSAGGPPVASPPDPAGPAPWSPGATPPPAGPPPEAPGPGPRPPA